MVSAIPMRKLLPLFACLMLLFSAWSGMAHAVESAKCSEMTQVEASSHSEFDGDQVPADEGKGYPHHHAGCHGHHVGTPATHKAMSQPLSGAGPFGADWSYVLAAYPSEPALRPPQA